MVIGSGDDHHGSSLASDTSPRAGTTRHRVMASACGLVLGVVNWVPLALLALLTNGVGQRLGLWPTDSTFRDGVAYLVIPTVLTLSLGLLISSVVLLWAAHLGRASAERTARIAVPIALAVAGAACLWFYGIIRLPHLP